MYLFEGITLKSIKKLSQPAYVCKLHPLQQKKMTVSPQEIKIENQNG